MTTKTLPARLATVLSCSVLAACASTTPHWDARFGDSVRSLNAQQVVRPQAAVNADPVAGMDGRTARAALERYERSLPEPKAAAAPVTNSSGK